MSTPRHASTLALAHPHFSRARSRRSETSLSRMSLSSIILHQMHIGYATHTQRLPPRTALN
eukprot:1678808-Rhodomonas_salina.2